MKHQTTLLGLNGYVDREKIDMLVASLSAIWQLSMGTSVSELECDLELCRRWFDPVAQGQRLRREVQTIPRIPEHMWDPGPPMTLNVSRARSLVTPEGRCLLDLLVHLPHDPRGQLISDAHLVPYDRLLAHLYREWARHRIHSVIDLLAGEKKPLQIPAAGVVIALLVNRSTSPDRALIRFPSGAARDVIDEAFFKAVESFAQTLAPKRRPTRDPRLISGWMLYEARRRLSDDVLIVEGARPDTEGRIWIDEAKQDQALEVVARDLSKGHRARVTTESLAKAFDALVATFRSETARLAGFGLAHERPANTKRIRDALVERFRHHVEE